MEKGNLFRNENKNERDINQLPLKEKRCIGHLVGKSFRIEIRCKTKHHTLITLYFLI